MSELILKLSDNERTPIIKGILMRLNSSLFTMTLKNGSKYNGHIKFIADDNAFTNLMDRDFIVMHYYDSVANQFKKRKTTVSNIVGISFIGKLGK